MDIEKLAFEFQTTSISLTKLAEREYTTRQTLAKKFKELGIEIINKQNKTKFNEHIFDSIDTEEKAYWLGFIFADGSIREQIEGKKVPYTFELSLKGDDIEHLKKFNSFMEYQGDNVKLGKSKCKNKEFSRCRWIITNKHLWTILNNLGCTPNKSLTLQFPNESIFSSKDLIPHFIRGYFDGDGCFTRHVYTHIVSPTISILGTPEFLDKIDEYSNIESIRRHDKRHSEKTYILEFNKENGIKFINYIYSNCNIYLDRKYKLYNFFKNGSRSVEEFTELQSGNIGEKLKLESRDYMYENPEINLETKESESSYSVGGETV